jgi:hypothetical protein
LSLCVARRITRPRSSVMGTGKPADQTRGRRRAWQPRSGLRPAWCSSDSFVHFAERLKSDDTPRQQGGVPVQTELRGRGCNEAQGGGQPGRLKPPQSNRQPGRERPGLCRGSVLSGVTTLDQLIPRLQGPIGEERITVCGIIRRRCRDADSPFVFLPCFALRLCLFSVLPTGPFHPRDKLSAYLLPRSGHGVNLSPLTPPGTLRPRNRTRFFEKPSKSSAPVDSVDCGHLSFRTPQIHKSS